MTETDSSQKPIQGPDGMRHGHVLFSPENRTREAAIKAGIPLELRGDDGRRYRPLGSGMHWYDIVLIGHRSLYSERQLKKQPSTWHPGAAIPATVFAWWTGRRCSTNPGRHPRPR